jgi:hypothetical protein
LVAALVTRLVLFPAGALASVSTSVRVTAFLLGLGAFLAFRCNLAIGIATGAGSLAAAQWIAGWL